MLFNTTGKFDAWKAELAVMLAQLAVERAGHPRTKMHAHAVTACIGMLVAAQSFKDVILALETLMPLEPSLQGRVETLKSVDALRIYLVGGCDPYLRDAYAECVADLGATRILVGRVQLVHDAVRDKVRHGTDALRGGVLDPWQRHLYQLATLNR